MKLRILLMAVIVAVSVVARVGGSDFTKTGLIGIITDSSDVPIPYAVVFVHEGKGKMIVRKVNPDATFSCSCLLATTRFFFFRCRLCTFL